MSQTLCATTFNKMPTIEIVSIDSSDFDLQDEEFVFAIRVNKKLISDRGLFYDFLIKQTGTIIHLGNPSMKDPDSTGFFASDLINWDFENSDAKESEPCEKLNHNDIEQGEHIDLFAANQLFKFQFDENYKADIDKILKTAIRNSKIKKAYFLTDIQSGPKKPKTEIIYNLNDFWDRHDNDGLEWNKLYEYYSE